MNSHHHALGGEGLADEGGDLWVRATVTAAWTEAFADVPEADSLTFWELGGASLTAANLAYDLGTVLRLDTEVIENLFLYLFTGPTLEECADHLAAIFKERQ